MEDHVWMYMGRITNNDVTPEWIMLSWNGHLEKLLK
jgi:hypothetical protein